MFLHARDMYKNRLKKLMIVTFGTDLVIITITLFGI